MRVVDMFRLGEAWPDWWAEKVTTNEVTTYNDDDRWRGGPDRARIIQGNTIKWATKGDYIALGPRGEIEVIRHVGTLSSQ